ncbi:MAG: class I SAM-dependent methyltransferase, partial [Deltaproteobacteria bacterium]|nr:class I SAM-dependent methyltransferase [Deltaproteobacteria bacterium]
MFIDLFRERFRERECEGYVLDLGCGPGDITFRFARAYPCCKVHGVDGSPAMLACGRTLLEAGADGADRIEFYEGVLPATDLPIDRYDVVISNSLLHHLQNAGVLWDSVKRFAAAGAPVFIMDLVRPASRAEAESMVATYAAAEAAVLQQDFFHSLLAAYSLPEVRAQLVLSGLDYLDVKQVSDRHMFISGIFR